MIKLAPSILSADFSNLWEDVKAVERAGVEYLHVDVMDGHFVPNITIGPLVVQALRNKSKLIFDVHLMIENPDLYIDDFVQAGADILTVHVEAAHHLHRTIQKIKEKGIKAAISLNPATPLCSVEFMLPYVDMILLMSVNPGFGGQKFIPEIIPKIKALRKMLDEQNLAVDIQVDGGINKVTAPLVVQAGANILVAGSAIFGAPSVEEAVAELRMVTKG